MLLNTELLQAAYKHSSTTPCWIVKYI